MSKKSKLENRRYLKIAIVSAIVLVSVVIVVRFSDDIFGAPSPYPGVGKLGSDHQNARFAVWMEGDRVSFSPRDYPKYALVNDYIFIDDIDGNTIHRFATSVSLEIFFESFGMKFNSNCFIINDDTDDVHNRKFNRIEYCNEGDKTLKFYVNKELNTEFEKYVLEEGDGILITYGNETEEEINMQQFDSLKITPGLAAGIG